MNIKAYGLTDIGKLRDENQDCFFIDERLKLFAVADGMGGMEKGALASRYTIEGLSAILKQYSDSYLNTDSETLTRFFKRTLSELSNHLCEALNANTGSTLVFCFISDNTAYIVNTGDSPAYLFRAGYLTQLTKDFNVAGALVEIGKITREEAKVHPLRNQLTAFIGMSGTVPLSVSKVELQGGDIMLLCTDGLTGMVEETTISEILQKGTDIEMMTKNLIDESNQSGGYDNITVILIKIEL